MIKGLFKRQVSRYLEHFEFVKPQLSYLGVLAVICFPSVHFPFIYLLDQPYDKLYLRLIASFSFLPIAFYQYLPKPIKNYIPGYFLICLLVWVSIFFSFMLNMNNGSPAWSASIMFGVIFIFTFLEWLTAISIIILGSIIGALIAYYFNNTAPISNEVLSTYIVMFFTLGFWAIMSAKTSPITEHKKKNMLAFGGKVAHDLRTPLLTISTTAAGIERYLPELIEAYEKFVPKDESSNKRLKQYKLLSKNSSSIKNQTRQLMLLTDMLLKTLRSENLSEKDFKVLSIKKEVEDFISIHQTNDERRLNLNVQIKHRFSILGISSMFHAVLYNLINNAYYAIQDQANGRIDIYTQEESGRYELIIKDNGVGISKHDLPYIFQEFYSTKSASLGTGLGLFAAHRIIRSFNGEIHCKSIHKSENLIQHGTIFRITFPETIKK